MSGYAANLVRSGARALTTRRLSYAAAALSTVLRETRAGQERTPAASLAEPMFAALAGTAHRGLANLSSPRQHVETAGAVVQQQPEPLLTASQLGTGPEIDFSACLSAPLVQPEQKPAPQHKPDQGTRGPRSKMERDGSTAAPQATDARLAASASSGQNRSSRVQGEDAPRSMRFGAPPHAAPVSERPEPDVSTEPALIAPEPARHGIYHGRRIRVEHSAQAPNRAATLDLPRSAPALPDNTTRRKGKEPALSTVSLGDHAARAVPSQLAPRVSSAAQMNSIGASEPSQQGSQGPSLSFSTRSAAAPPTSAHALTLAPAEPRRSSSREAKSSEGPRLSIGLLEVQIIQDPSPAPQTRPPSHSSSEHDDLERSYVRHIG
jgi:hypothetical protein